MTVILIDKIQNIKQKYNENSKVKSGKLIKLKANVVGDKKGNAEGKRDEMRLDESYLGGSFPIPCFDDVEEICDKFNYYRGS